MKLKSQMNFFPPNQNQCVRNCWQSQRDRPPSVVGMPCVFNILYRYCWFTSNLSSRYIVQRLTSSPARRQALPLVSHYFQRLRDFPQTNTCCHDPSTRTSIHNQLTIHAKVSLNRRNPTTMQMCIVPVIFKLCLQAYSNMVHILDAYS